MSPTTTAPDPVVPVLPLRMTYEVSMSPATTTSGRIEVQVTSTDVPRVACDYIIIDVPIGTREGDIFIRAPRIEINTLNWAPSGQESAVVPPAADKVSQYYRFTIKNQAPNALVPLLPFKFIITGNVNTENMHTNQAKLVVRERSVVAEGLAFPEGIAFREATYPVAKYESFLLYINSFYSTNPDQSEIPQTEFINGKAINLSWESNGHSFELYQGGRKVYEGERSSYEVRTIKRDNDGHALDKDGKIITKKDEKGKDVALSNDDEVFSDRLVVLGKGISADTTFVLKATSSTGASLYETLTLMVSNPHFSPAPITLKSLLEQVDDATLKIALELNADDVIQALVRASETNVDQKIRASPDSNFATILGGNYIEGMRLRDVLAREAASKGLNLMEPSKGIALRKALRETRDSALKAAIEQAPDAALRNALKPADTTEVRRAISNNDVPTVNRLIGNSYDSRIRFALQVSENPATTFTLEQSDDTAHCLRLSDGTPNGNLVLQALSGDKSGMATLSFNGYFGGGEKQFNPTKARYRVGTDQRGGRDCFFIDTYSKNDAAPKPAFTVLANGNVGIGTSIPTAKLHVDGAVKITGNVGIGTDTPAAKLHAVGQGGDLVDLIVNGRMRTGDSKNQGGVWLDGANTQFVGQAGPTTLGFWNSGDWRLSVANNGNVGIGTGSPDAKLHVNGAVKIVGSNVLEFGGGVAGKEVNAGKIGYGTFENNSLNIVGAGSQGDNRKIQFWAEGGAGFYGNVGIGNNSPSYPLHVTKIANYTNGGWFGYLNMDGSGYEHSRNRQTFEISIYADKRVVASEINAVSDGRLKTIAGRSDSAADLALLRRLRITDYTMRDRVQFGDQAFKKIIGQELEEVFPQAVHQHIDFLPDIYATASQVQRQGKALLITLPADLPQTATAGQRLKLIGPAGEVLATLAEAAEAGSQQLLVTGADSLADTPGKVFVFGLEHADVRAVDYEAVAMLNVSATQALARQVDELHQQNTALHAQCRAQGTQVDELRAALHLLQQQVAGLLRQPAGVAQPA